MAHLPTWPTCPQTTLYHLLTPLTLTIDRATSYRLLEYIRSAATVPRPVTLRCAFFFYHRHLAYDQFYVYDTTGAARSSVSTSNLRTTIVRRYSLLATMSSPKSNPIPRPNLRRQSIPGEFNSSTLALTPEGKPSGLKEL